MSVQDREAVEMPRGIVNPPSVGHLNQASDNYEKYLRGEEKDRLVQSAVIKARFELIQQGNNGCVS